MPSVHPHEHSENRVSNARLEGIDNKIGVLKHRAYGFHSAVALIAMIYLTCTKLSIELPI